MTTIRRCSTSDLKHILSIERQSFNHPYPAHVFTHFLNSHPEGFVVSEEAGEVCGYIIFTVQQRKGLIISIAVSPRFRRRGHGTMLLQYALRELAEKTRIVDLQVRPSDRDAVEFYGKHGFRVCSTIRRYYPDGEDALVMRREV